MDWDARRIGRHLKLRDLNVLMAVVRWGSMGKAAAQLAVSQPAVSKTIADMEHSLGVRLLDRSSHGVEPTIYATALLDHGIIAFDELEQAIRKIESLADPSQGHLRIGCTVVLAQGFVANVITRMTQRYPRVTFQLMAEESGSIYRALEDRKLDLAIARIFNPVPAHLTAQVLYDDRHVVAAGTRNPWNRRRRIQLADLMNEQWVLPPLETLTGSIVREAFRARGLEVPPATVITSSTPARLALVAGGTVHLYSSDHYTGAFRQEAGAKSAADRFIDRPQTNRSCHSERPRTQPSSAAFHRDRWRRREIVRELNNRSANATSVMGHKRTSESLVWNVCFAPESRHPRVPLLMSALCHEWTWRRHQPGSMSFFFYDGARVGPVRNLTSALAAAVSCMSSSWLVQGLMFAALMIGHHFSISAL